jgi:hypothetical protein
MHALVPPGLALLLGDRLAEEIQDVMLEDRVIAKLDPTTVLLSLGEICHPRLISSPIGQSRILNPSSSPHRRICSPLRVGQRLVNETPPTKRGMPVVRGTMAFAVANLKGGLS